MILQHSKRLIFTSTAAVVLALASTAALASAMSYEGENEADVKTAACSLIGCQNGNRLCGSAGGTIKLGIMPFVGEVNVTYTCYEESVAF